MKIGFDLRPLQGPHRYRGIGVYLRNLIQGIGELDRANTYIFWIYRGSNPLAELSLPKDFRYEVRWLPKPRGHIVLDNLKRTYLAPLRLSNDLDCFFLPDVAYGWPRGSVPIVAVCYDLMPHLFRQEIFPSNPARLLRDLGVKGLVGSYTRRSVYVRQQRAFLKADQVVSISEATKQDLLAYLPTLDPAKITVVPLAAATLPAIDPAAESAIRKHLGLPADYLLYIGGADFRKNLPALIEAFDQVTAKRAELSLVLAGKDFDPERGGENPHMWELIDASPARERILLLGYVDDLSAAVLYRGAQTLVSPSLYEGFGLTVLEAMSAGCPVIAYDTSSIPEVAGRAAILLKPGDPLASAISGLLDSYGQRQELITAGLKQAKLFSWKRTAQATIQILQKAGERSS